MNAKEQDAESAKKMGINFLVIAGVLLALVFVSIAIADG